MGIHLPPDCEPNERANEIALLALFFVPKDPPEAARGP